MEVVDDGIGVTGEIDPSDVEMLICFAGDDIRLDEGVAVEDIGFTAVMRSTINLSIFSLMLHTACVRIAIA